MNTVFKVSLTNRPTPLDGKRFHNRRPHIKSRAGCAVCKHRRIKCDETRPTCTRCRDKGMSCVYQTSLDAGTPGKYHPAPNADAHNLSLSTLEAQIDKMLEAGVSADLTGGIRSLRDLQHFNESTIKMLGFLESQVIMTSIVSDAVWQHSYLMHLCLAVSNAHSRRLYKDCSNAAVLSQTGFRAAAHWQIALKLYRQELDLIKKDPKVYRGSVDAVMAATFLSVVFAFAVEDDIPVDTFVRNDEASILHAVNPLASTGGFRALITIMPHLWTRSQWRYVLQSSDDAQQTFSSMQDGIDGLPPAFVKVCGLTNDTTSENLYHRMLRRLIPLLALPPSSRSIPKLIAFMGDVWLDIKPRLVARERITLLLLSWWLVRLVQIDIWWLSASASSELKAILKYLHSLRDSEIQPLLEYPDTAGQADIDWIWAEAS